MKQKQALWQLAQETMQAMAPFYRDSMRAAIESSGVPQAWFGLSLARGCHPKPLTVDCFHQMNPYSRRERYENHLKTLAESGFMRKIDLESFVLTNEGIDVIEGIFASAQKEMESIETLPEEEMNLLNNLLLRLVQASLSSPQPEAKWAIAYSRWTDPGDQACPAVKTDQYITDLTRFRDDVHNAAWHDYAVDGSTWEAFTFIWRGDANTPDQLVEALPYRQIDIDGYAHSLDQLVRLEWIEKTKSGYQVTGKGRKIRQQAEDETDRLFFDPWQELSTTDLDTLQRLLAKFKAKLEIVAPVEEE